MRHFTLLMSLAFLYLCIFVTFCYAKKGEKTTKLAQDVDDCTKRNESCSKCTDSDNCYWCEPSKSCHVYQGKKIVPRDCPDNKWYVKQCLLAGNLLIIIIPSVVGVVLIFLCCCIYCCCCRRYKKWRLRRMDKKDEKNKRKKEERLALQSQKNKDRQAKRDAIRDKYGLSGSGSKYEKLPDSKR